MVKIELSDDEAEDVCYALARLADCNEIKADQYPGLDLQRVLLEQAERFRQVARKVTDARNLAP